MPDSKPTARILVVEDDPDSLRLITFFLSRAGYEVLTAKDGATGLMLAEQERPDLVVLDWMLPLMNGLEICRRLRQRSRVPILMLTAKDSVADRVEGLDTGADDYLIKPFAPEELLARVSARLRISSPPAAANLAFADLQLSVETHEASRGGRPLALSPKEFDLLRCFMNHPDKVLRRTQILNEVWGDESNYDGNILDVYVGYLRQKMEADGQPRLIHTKRGVGFVLSEMAPVSR